MLTLRDLHIGYRTRQQSTEVFGGLNATFEKGRLVGLVGHNGVGKSTLIKTMFGVLPPLSGEVLIDGRPVSGFTPGELARLISIVLTDKVGGFNLTVSDVVAAGRIPYLNAFGQLGRQDEAIVTESIARAGIADLKNRLIDELSDGQRQKVMIAKSLAQQTPVILLDEPTAFLDYKARRQLFDSLKQLCREEQKTIIVSSHDLDILFKNADEILYLKDDRTYRFAPPAVIEPDFR